ncbi:MAG: peptidoglycan editing factor PgeF [Clostridia bacterium]|nr:peptidoglycan editing factor PgeF [Clostridia bacterium]
MFYLKNYGALIYAASDAITVPHGFSTRTGGVSTLDHVASMNFTTSTGDSEANVAENYRILLSALGLEPDSRVSSHQIHSARVRYVTEADRGRVFDDCDGFVTDRPGVTLVVKTADCVPILLADADAGVIAAVHAGWRGTVAGIAPNAVSEMLRVGANLGSIRVAIGACIHDCCFEVQNDFVEAVAAARGDAFADAHIRRKGSTRYADLVGMNCALLAEAGIAPSQIDIAADCTCCAPFLYHSHRATGGRRGTMASVIGIL